MTLVACRPSAGVAQIAFTRSQINGNFEGGAGVFAADIDGDGDLDVLSAENHSWDIVWWENTAGDGSAWTEHTIDASFQVATGVSAADIDGDGDMDVLGAALFGDDISWWENTAGDGSAWTEVTIDAEFDGASAVFAADIDGDGDLDVLGAAQSGDQIAWWENTAGDGSAWTEGSIDNAFDGAMSVYAADVDRDGDLDVLGAAQNAGVIAWWENTAGDGSAWSKATIESGFTGAQNVHATDIDGDGDLDVLGSALNANDIAWWENTAGDGSLWTKRIIDSDFSGARRAFGADLDGDGDIDVLGTAENARDVAWWENTAGDGSAWTEHLVDGEFVGARDVFAADLDGDGDLDVLGGSNSNSADNVVWWKNSHSGRATSVGTKTTVDDSFDGARTVCHGDVDGDGDLDIVAGASAANAIAWWKNTAGDGSAWSETTIGSSFDAVSIFCADVDGDGDLDVMGAAFDHSQIAWWENTAGDGSSWTKVTVDAAFGTAQGIFGADLDHDGDVDILGAAFGSDTISWWKNTAGDGSSWTEQVLSSSFNGARSVSAGDIDGDGDLDVVAAAFDGDDISWWENTVGDGSAWTERAIDGSFDGAIGIALGDLDGDGDLDVVGAGFVADEIAWWDNTAGTGLTWTKRSVATSFDGATGLSVADINHDGSVDVVGTAFLGDAVTWWENTNGSGTSWTTRSVDAAYDGAYAAFGADVDGDGDLDILGAAIVADDVTWWANDTVILNQGLVISGTAGQSNNAGWRLLAPPCGSQTRSGMSGVSITGDDEIRRYDESAGFGDDQWLSTGSADALPQGSGFAVYLYDDVTQEVGADFGVVFGACTPTNTDVVVSTLDVNEEWFLAGNPYMQSFDLSSLSGTGFQTTYNLWNPSTATYTNITAEAGSSDVIKVGQGFFVQRTTVGAGGTSLTFDDAGKTSGGTFVGKRGGGDTIRLPIVLRVTDADGQLIANDESASILFADDATLSWDHYESGKLKPLLDRWATVALMGDRAGRPVPLSLLSLPADLSITATIPLRIDVEGISGRATLSWGDVAALPDDWQLELRDLDTGFSRDLRRVANHTFPLTGETSRFELVVATASSTSPETETLPTHYELAQNYPNPFNPQTVIRFGLPQAGRVTLTVHDLLGREVSRLIDGPKPAGWHQVGFDADHLASGPYVYRLVTPHAQMSRAMHLIR